jgi:hypothetical protein
MLALGVGLILCLMPDKLLPSQDSMNPSKFPAWAYWLQALLAVLSIGALLEGTRNPFIYFNF